MYVEYEFIAEESFGDFVEEFMDGVTRSFLNAANEYIRKTDGQIQRVIPDQPVKDAGTKKR